MASQCPKCHQWIEEDYICCADIEFQWKCQSCHKRSHGFALPFGRCPLCGGQLERVDIEDHPSKEDLGILQEAIQAEINSYHLYSRLAEAVNEPKFKEFFESLAEMEKEHATELCEKYHFNLKDSIFDDPGAPLPSPYAESLDEFSHSGNMNTLFDCAIELEKKTHNFFQERATQLPEGHARELYLELAAEELEHIDLLEAQRAKIEK